MSHSAATQLVGAFSTKEGKGNPVYVVYDMGSWTINERQRFTSFANLSECVFVQSIEGVAAREPTIKVQIFNPNGSMKFAGHPLIGTIRSLHDKLGINSGTIDTGAVTVSFRSKESTDGRLAELEIPDPQSNTYDQSFDLCRIYNLPTVTLPIYDCGPRHVLLRMPDRRSLTSFDPQWEQLKQFNDIALNVYHVGESYVENRMFSPSYGVYEDRATGSAVIPLLKEMRINNPSIETIRVVQGTNRQSGVMMQGSYLPERKSYFLSGATNSVLVGEVLP